jgi:hypothetical protein
LDVRGRQNAVIVCRLAWIGRDEAGERDRGEGHWKCDFQTNLP